MERKERTGKPKHNKSTFEAAAAVCDTSTRYIAYLVGRVYVRTYVVGLLPCYPVCRLLTAFFNRYM